MNIPLSKKLRPSKERYNSGMYPRVFASSPAAPMGVDTDERRKVARALTDALYEYLTLPITEMERAYKAQAQFPRVTVEGIVHLQDEINKRRDVLAANREKMVEGLKGLPQGMEG